MLFAPDHFETFDVKHHEGKEWTTNSKHEICYMAEYFKNQRADSFLEQTKLNFLRFSTLGTCKFSQLRKWVFLFWEEKKK